MKKTVIILFALLFCTEAVAQSVRSQLRNGNREYNKEKYDEAEVSYRHALEQDSTDFRGQYNLGNTLYRQKKYAEAGSHFAQALQRRDLSEHQRARTLHNQGNCFLQAGLEDREQGMQNFQQAVKSYQESLKLEPKDEDTRYNLAYARRLLQQAQQQQQNQGGGNGQNKDNKQKQNQQQQGNNQQQNQQKQDQQQGQQPQPQQGNKNQQQRQKQKADQRKQDAERMLEAVKNNERQTLKEQNKKLQVGTVKQTDKDW